MHAIGIRYLSEQLKKSTWTQLAQAIQNYYSQKIRGQFGPVSQGNCPPWLRSTSSRCSPSGPVDEDTGGDFPKEVISRRLQMTCGARNFLETAGTNCPSAVLLPSRETHESDTADMLRLTCPTVRGEWSSSRLRANGTTELTPTQGTS